MPLFRALLWYFILVLFTGSIQVSEKADLKLDVSMLKKKKIEFAKNYSTVFERQSKAEYGNFQILNQSQYEINLNI
jgi:hypothetical protein